MQRRKPNNGPTFAKKAATGPRIQYDPKGRRRSFIKGSRSAKVGNLKRWSRW